MKLNRYITWGLSMFTFVLFISCASHQEMNLPQPGPTKNLPQPAPAENLPQIGTRQAALPVKTFRPPVLVSMIKKAENELGSGKPGTAFNTLERALGIDNQDPLIWHLMARAQLMQGNFLQAQTLAEKSNILAVHTPSLEKKNWAVIADALEKQGKIQKAAEAEKKARE